MGLIPDAIYTEERKHGSISGQLGDAIRFLDDDNPEWCPKCRDQMFIDALGYICGNCGRHVS